MREHRRTNVVKNNAAGGKGPCGGRVGGAGKREGMAGRTGPNDPGGRRPRDKVRQLQRRLWAAAKRSPERRFHALYGHIWRGDVLLGGVEAGEEEPRRGGRRWSDDRRSGAVRSRALPRRARRRCCAAGKYRPKVVLRRYIPKADGKKRPLGHPDGPRPSGADGGEAGAGADLRGGFSSVLVRFPARSGARRWRSRR